MNAYQKIQQAQKEMERFVLSVVREANKEGRLWNYRVPSIPLMNAIDRLEARGQIKYRKRTLIGGYEISK